MLSACIPELENLPFTPNWKALLPSRGIAFSDVLPEPLSAPIPVISSCSSPMVSLFVR